MLDTLRQTLVLLITSYPIVMPLLERFKEDFSDGLNQIADSLPKITEVLNEMANDPEVTNKFMSQLMEVMPELEGLFRKLES